MQQTWCLYFLVESNATNFSSWRTFPISKNPVHFHFQVPTFNSITKLARFFVKQTHKFRFHPKEASTTIHHLTSNGPTRLLPAKTRNIGPGPHKRHRDAGDVLRRRSATVDGERSAELDRGEGGHRVQSGRSENQNQSFSGRRRWNLLRREQSRSCGEEGLGLRASLGRLAEALVPEASRIHRISR